MPLFTRNLDVYVGVDVWGRNTASNGGFDAYSDVSIIQRAGSFFSLSLPQAFRVLCLHLDGSLSTNATAMRMLSGRSKKQDSGTRLSCKSVPRESRSFVPAQLVLLISYVSSVRYHVRSGSEALATHFLFIPTLLRWLRRTSFFRVSARIERTIVPGSEVHFPGWI